MADLEAHTNEPRDLQCVVLAGGLGTRISEESHLRPKPMIEIAGKPPWRRYAEDAYAIVPDF